MQQSGAYVKINRNTIMGVTGTPADISSSQTLTNKTLGNTNIFTIRDDRFTLQDNADTTKQAVFQLSGITTATTRTYTLPNASTTLVGSDNTVTMTNKTLTSPAITGGTVSNVSLQVDAVAEFTAANGVTVDGLNIKDGKLNTNNSVVTASVTDGAITPAKLQSGTGTSWTWASWSPTYAGLTPGNGTTTARYIQIGKTVVCRLSFVLGTTSSVASSVTFTLPVTAATYPNLANTFDIIGVCDILDSGTASFNGDIRLASTTTGLVIVGGAGGTYVQATTLTNLIPMTWAQNDAISATFIYEAA